MMPVILYWSLLSVMPPIVFSTLWPDLVSICDLWPDLMHRVTQECSIPPGTTGKTRRFGWKQHFVKLKIIPRRPRVLAMVGRCKLSFEQTTIKRLNKRERSLRLRPTMAVRLLWQSMARSGRERSLGGNENINLPMWWQPLFIVGWAGFREHQRQNWVGQKRGVVYRSMPNL